MTKFDLDWWTKADSRARDYGARGDRLGFSRWLPDATLGAQNPDGIRETLSAWFEAGKNDES